jgi:hypothetical protein
MFVLHVLDYLFQAAPLEESLRNAGLCRFDSTVLCEVVLSDFDTSVSAGHRHVPRCADVQTQLDFFVFNQFVDCIDNLIEELNELRPAWIAERRHLVRSVFTQTDLVLLYHNETLLADFKRYFCSVTAECDRCNSLNMCCSVIVLFYPALTVKFYHVSSLTIVCPSAICTLVSAPR